MKKVTMILAVMLFSLSGGAFAFDFWGITMGTEYYMGAQQLTFSEIPSGASDPYIGYEVGGYSYTKVGSVWNTNPYPAASPGASYPTLQRKCDAMGLFFMPDENNAKFMIITGMPESGATASEVGYGTRQFGPGDLKIDVTDTTTSNVTTYGVGLRNGGLNWAVDPSSTAPWFQVYDSSMTVMDMNSRDAGTKGDIVANPTWGHVDNHVLTAYDPHGYAFYVDGTGTQTGSTSSINVAGTGVFLNGVQFYAYEVVVPWAALGVDTSLYSFEASWRPDCGNDLIFKQFTGSKPGMPNIPEPYSVLLAAMGLSAVAAYRKRR